mgnify:CR=1 FL=1
MSDQIGRRLLRGENHQTVPRRGKRGLHPSEDQVNPPREPSLTGALCPKQGTCPFSVVIVSTNLSGDETTTLSRLVSSGTAKVIRERAGFTASDFASRVGVASRTLRSWESGRSTPRQPYAARKYLAELRRASLSIVNRVEQNRASGAPGRR